MPFPAVSAAYKKRFYLGASVAHGYWKKTVLPKTVNIVLCGKGEITTKLSNTLC